MRDLLVKLVQLDEVNRLIGRMMKWHPEALMGACAV